ncbi:MAG: LysR family transcriptional regulator [Bradymonadaceae bacterium]|nr:LysR family transcriptional regulator [Lujinxingiaceae bacterium]
MDLTQLYTFTVLAKEGHMTRAAAKLHLTQPAVSTQLARLEEDLGQVLFDRTPKGMVLTEAGHRLLPYAEEVLSRLDDARSALEEMAGLHQGSLSIGGGATATTYLLPPLLGKFHEGHPAIRFFVREQPSQSVVDDVYMGKLDLGIVTLPIRPPSGVSSLSGKIEIEHWVEDELRLLVPEHHRLAGCASFSWPQLDGEALVLFEAGSAVRALIDYQIAQAQIDVDIVMELRSIESIKQMVAQGIGAAFVSQYALGHPEQGIRCQDAPLRRQLAVIYRSDRTQSVAARAFLEMMRSLGAPLSPPGTLA